MTLIGALSGKPLSIQDELFARATRLRQTPEFDPVRYCFLVTDEEWDALETAMKACRRQGSDHAELPNKKMFILEIEVRKRG